MKFFECGICNSHREKADIQPQICPFCGAVNGPWNDVSRKFGLFDKFTIFNDFGKLLIFNNRNISRKDIQLFFPKLIDKNGNLIYKYFDNDKPMLSFEKNSSGFYLVNSPFSTKNYFLLNGEILNEKKVQIELSMVFSLFSDSQKEIVSEFFLK